jgi:hypothetical protein
VRLYTFLYARGKTAVILLKILSATVQNSVAQGFVHPWFEASYVTASDMGRTYMDLCDKIFLADWAIFG